MDGVTPKHIMMKKNVMIKCCALDVEVFSETLNRCTLFLKG